MNGCVYRTEENKCKQFSVGGVLSFCYLDGACDCRIPSNADRLRSMSDEELAEWATTVGRTFGEEYEGYMSALEWLKATVEEVDNG